MPPRSSNKSLNASHSSHPKALNQIRIIGGDWKRTCLPVLDSEGLRPTPSRVRETVFNWLGQRLDGLACLDLFAGSGALGFEAASRGATRVLMVERQPRIVQQLRQNQAKLNAKAIEIVQADALKLAAQLAPESFDMVFLDPPFNANFLPQALCLSLPLLRRGGTIYLEAPTPFDQLNLAVQGAAHDTEATGGGLDSSWQVVRYKKAGAVHYHLLQQIQENPA